MPHLLGYTVTDFSRFNAFSTKEYKLSILYFHSSTWFFIPLRPIYSTQQFATKYQIRHTYFQRSVWHYSGRYIQLSSLQQSTKFATLISNKVCVITFLSEIVLFTELCIQTYNLHILCFLSCFIFVSGSRRRLIIVMVMIISPPHRGRFV
jgi:hypothetical protein